MIEVTQVYGVHVNRINCIKKVRERTGCGLHEAREAVEALFCDATCISVQVQVREQTEYGSDFDLERFDMTWKAL